jgi:hypothetical protein
VAAPPPSPSPPPPAPSPSPPAPPPPPPAPPNDSWQSGGQIQVNDGRCGWCNSSPGAPNGAEEWLNCGIHSGGWTPPYLALNQVVAADLNANGIFAPCAPYFDLFTQYGGEFGSESRDVARADQFPPSCWRLLRCRSLLATLTSLAVVGRRA